MSSVIPSNWIVAGAERGKSGAVAQYRSLIKAGMVPQSDPPQTAPGV